MRWLKALAAPSAEGGFRANFVFSEDYLRLTGLAILFCFSGRNFDASLKSRNPDWGVRKLAEVIKAAEKEGLELVEKVEMPANNTSLIFRRRRKLS